RESPSDARSRSALWSETTPRSAPASATAIRFQTGTGCVCGRPRPDRGRTPAGAKVRRSRLASFRPPSRFLRRSPRVGGVGGPLGVGFEELFEARGLVLEAAADVDALQGLVVALVGRAEVGGHGVGIVEIGDGCREVCLAGEQ